MFRSCTLVLAAVLVAMTLPAQDGSAEPGVKTEAGQRFVVDGAGSLVYALVYKKGAASSAAHDHVVHATVVDGWVRISDDDPARASVLVSIPVAGLRPDEPDMRKMAGFPDTLSEKQRAGIRSNIRSKRQLYAEEHPVLSFESSSVAIAADQVLVDGTMSMRGVSRPLSLTMRVESAGQGLRAIGRFSIRQSDFGYKPFSSLMGALKLKDEVVVVLDLLVLPAPSD